MSKKSQDQAREAANPIYLISSTWQPLVYPGLLGEARYKEVMTNTRGMIDATTGMLWQRPMMGNLLEFRVQLLTKEEQEQCLANGTKYIEVPNLITL